MMKSFRDPLTGVLKARGYVEANEPGDVARDEPEDFDLQPGHWRLYGEEWVPHSAEQIPFQVTKRQARQALIRGGHIAAVEAALAGIPGLEGELARAEWEDSQVVERNRPLTKQLGAAIGLSPGQIDQLFITAATL